MIDAIKVHNLKKIYPNFKLDSISFNVKKGYITGFIGPNGSGKTTTLKAILNYIQRDDGSIEVNGENVDPQSARSTAIGVVMDDMNFIKAWTMTDIEKAVAPFYPKWSSKRYYELLSQFGIARNLKVEALSKGMSVKCMLAVALSYDADILILDEPTSGLDPLAREEICDILQDYVQNEEKTVFFSTHITKDLETIADHIIFIHDGKIVVDADKEAIFEQYRKVSGGLEDLALLDHYKVIGLKKNAYSFDALIEGKLTGDEDNLKEMPISLDDLIVLYERGEHHA